MIDTSKGAAAADSIVSRILGSPSGGSAEGGERVRSPVSPASMGAAGGLSGRPWAPSVHPVLYRRKEMETMIIQDIVPVVAVVVVDILFVLLVVVRKIAATRANSQRRARGEKPLTEETEFVNVIDWTRR